MTKNITASADKLDPTSELRFMEDAGPQRQNRTFWQSLSALFRSSTVKRSQRFPELARQYALGHIPAERKGPRNREEERARSNLDKTTDRLFGRILALTMGDDLAPGKPTKSALSVAKRLIDAQLTVNRVPPHIRKKVEKAFQGNLKKVAAQKIALELREPLAKHLTSSENSLSTLGNVVVKCKSDLMQKFVKKGFFASDSEARKEVMAATAQFLAQRLKMHIKNSN